MNEEVRSDGRPRAARDVGVALRELVDRVKRGASGELVCACASAEVHVFLQNGRVAWANDSRHRHAFTGHLREHAGIDENAVGAAVEECRRTRRPIGEVFLGWKLATKDQIGAAIQHQAMLALDCFRSPCEGPRTVFLDRSRYDKYDPNLTFGLSDLAPDLAADGSATGGSAPRPSTSGLESGPPPATGAAPPPGAGPARTTPPAAPPLSPTEVLATLRSIPGVLHAVIIGKDGVRIGDDSYEGEELSGRALYVAMVGEQLRARLRVGEIHLASVHGTDRHLLLFKTRSHAIAVLVDPATPVGKVEAAVRNAIRRPR